MNSDRVMSWGIGALITSAIIYLIGIARMAIHGALYGDVPDYDWFTAIGLIVLSALGLFSMCCLGVCALLDSYGGQNK